MKSCNCFYSSTNVCFPPEASISNQKRIFDAVAALTATILFLCTFHAMVSTGKQKEIAFIDSGVKDSLLLADGVRQEVEVVMLDPQGDKLAQMAKELQGRNSSLDAIHIIFHGSTGMERPWHEAGCTASALHSHVA